MSNWFKNRRQREREPPRKDASGHLLVGHDSSPERPLHHYPDETLTQGDYFFFSFLSHFTDRIQIEHIEMNYSFNS